MIKSRKSVSWGSPEHPWSEWFTTQEGKEWAHANGVDKPITDPVILARIAAIIRPVLEEREAARHVTPHGPITRNR